MRKLIAITFIAVSACTNAAQQAEKEYAIVKNSGDAAAVCRKGEEVAEAYLKAGDEAKYNEAKTGAAIECQSRTRDEANGDFRMPDGSTHHIEADDLSTLPDNT